MAERADSERATAATPANIAPGKSAPPQVIATATIKWEEAPRSSERTFWLEFGLSTPDLHYCLTYGRYLLEQ